MQVLIEPTKNGFIARTAAPWNIVVEGINEQDTLNHLRAVVSEQLSKGVKIINLPLPESEEENPWVKVAGIFKDDPTFDDWQEAIQEYRRERDAEIFAEEAK